MKKRFLSLLLSAAAIAFICNCGEDPSSSSNDEPKTSYVVSEPSYIYTKGGKTYAISQATGTVSDTLGNVIGYFAAITDPATGLPAIDPATQLPTTVGNITSLEGTPIASNVDLAKLDLVQPPVITANAWVLSTNSQNYVIYGNGSVTDENGNPVGIFAFITDPATGLPAVDPETQLPTTVGNIYALDGVTPLFTNVDLNNLRFMGPTVNVDPLPESSSSLTPVSSSNTPASSGTIHESSSSQGKNSSSSAKSSSSVKSSSSAKSSSSSAKSSSSQSTYQIKYVNGGASGSGWATRYWDCCKPHCAWPDKGGLKARTCDASGKEVHDDSENSSMCKGGNAGTCKDQMPIVVNDTLAFAFAAVPGSAGGQCGKCFDLAFTGKGKYATDNHKKLAGKHLIVIASNIGYDVEAGQFDVMIPGGGVGIFNGCSKMNWGSQGAQYGGLLTECEESSNYKASTYKSCLTEKCNSSFSSDAKAKEGCLFLANWMNASGNPLHNYKEVECPQELLDKF